MQPAKGSKLAFIYQPEVDQTRRYLLRAMQTECR
jgi:hypothetical protein